MIDLISAYAAGFISALAAIFGVLYWVSIPKVIIPKEDAAFFKEDEDYKAARRKLYLKIYNTQSWS